ncbi:MAG: gamma-glutamyl-gamma-aminobutyrate hydrolase family protein [Fimbriimonadaceae bacterium]|nr:gamma-glutamyl-gamma-aminobutyrate hydrolase family protein [Fimbriimonadaceae bacterium]
MSRPVIGIGAGIQKGDDGRERLYIRIEYADRVWEAGGRPVILPPGPIEETDFDFLDGYLITGGDDIPGEEFGEPTHPEATLEDPRRLNFEMDWLKNTPRDMPVLGICLGCQLINVVRGGSLHQHIPDHLGHSQHRSGETETIQVDTSSLLGEMVGEVARGESLHHQAVNRVGENLRVAAHAADGTVEAIEDTSGRWVVGVQWHPERSPDTTTTQNLFREFVAAAKLRKEARESA